MTHLYLIRHGQAIRAIERTLSNSDLSPLGVRQVERLRDRLAATGEIAADVLISSTMRRARQTAEIIAPALGLPIIFDEEVEERRDGQAEGARVEEFEARFKATPPEQKAFFRVAPDAESWPQFMLRACTALNRITHEHEGKTIVIACHGGIIDASFIFFLGLSTMQFPPAFFATHNASITHWNTRTDLWLPTERAWILERYNDIMHLRDLDAPTRIPWRALAARPATGADASESSAEAE